MLKHRLLSWLLMPIILSLLLPAQVQPAGPHPHRGIVPEPYPFSDRYPAEVILTTAEQLNLLLRADIDIGSVRPLFPGRPFPSPGQPFEPLRAEVYVNEDEAAGLERQGLSVIPIPNESLRAHLAYPQGSGMPEAWPTYAEFVARMQTIASNYPSIVRMVSIGQSVQGRDIWMLKITDNPDLEEDEPEFKYTSSLHGDETVGVEMTLRLAELLTQNYGSDPALTELVDEIEIWLLPINNPDGYVNSSRYNAHGVDLNRDFPDRITDPHNDPAGREPETQAMMYFGYDHRFTMGANYHGGAAVVNYPWDSVPNPPDYAPDDTLYYEYSVGYAVRNSRIWNGGFPNGVTRGWEWYIIRGGMQDWAYHWQGEHHVTIELGNTKKPPYEQMDIYWNENREAMLWWMRRVLEGVRGRVYDAVSGAPLDATVNVLPIDKAVRTDPDVGDYHRLLLPGTYTLVCHAEGYLDQSWPITVVSGTATVQDCAMWREVDYAVAVGDSSAAGAPGQAVTHTLTITNTGTGADIYTIALGPSTWPATLLTPQVGPLQPQQAGQALVQVHIPLLPLTATVIASDVLTLEATSQGDPNVSAQGTATTYAVADLAVEMGADPPSRHGPPGRAITYTLDITNVGTYTDVYGLSLSGNTWPAQVTPAQVGPLGAGQTTPAYVRVEIPTEPSGLSDTVTVRATSGWNPQVRAALALTTWRIQAGVIVADSQAWDSPGKTVTHTLAVTNTGQDSDTFTITLVSGTWPATLLTPQVGPLQPQQAGQALVQVHIPLLPLTATVIASDVLTLEATSQGDPNVVAQGTATTYAVADLAVEMGADLRSQGGLAGQVLTYTLRITNTGGYTDRYTLTLLGNDWPAAVWPTQTVALPPGETATVRVRVTIPAGPAGETDSFFVRATSGWNPSVYAEQHLLARRNWAVYLPIVNRQQAWRR